MHRCQTPAHPIRSAHARIAIILGMAFLIGVAGCAPQRPLPRERVINVVPAQSPYNFHHGRTLLTQARLEEQANRPASARDVYRQSALAWPGLTEAWQGLARTADAQEAEAANFLAARTALTDPNDILTQREVAPALRHYLDQQRTIPEANPLTLDYGDRLAGFYADLYATRGVYDPPRRFGNIKPNEMPTAIITGLATSVYIGTVFTGTESAR